MKHDVNEIAAVEEVLSKDAAIAELAELQLAVIGGGTGEVVWS